MHHTSANGMGWTVEGDHLVPVTTDLPSEILHVVKCGCKTACSSGMCTCRKNGLKCMSACRCHGSECENADHHISPLELQCSDIDDEQFDMDNLIMDDDIDWIEEEIVV